MRSGREVDHPPHLMPNLRMSGAIPPYAFTAWTGDKPNVLHAACLVYNKMRLFFTVLLLVNICIWKQRDVITHNSKRLIAKENLPIFWKPERACVSHTDDGGCCPGVERHLC
jgi:hypothetical protein